MPRKSKEEKSVSKAGGTTPEANPSTSPKKGEKPAKKAAGKDVDTKKPSKNAGTKAAVTKKTPAKSPKKTDSTGNKKAVKTASRSSTKTTAAAPDITISNEEIALRAYYIAERRQKMGWPGDETSDWVEAERQLRAEAARKISKKPVI